MDPISFAQETFRLFVNMSIPIVAGCAAGAFVACLFQFVLQLEERGLSYLSRLAGVSVAIAISLKPISAAIGEFATTAWTQNLVLLQ